MISGIGMDKTASINLDEDWDPEKYDSEMAKVFNDDYFDEGTNGGND